ncbi:adenosylcobinamide kinase/adenosylcobinamide-phosphate guanylyltransferase [Salmonella enterica subsp. enterica]|uniref:Bifunctional adenosylcobalamin biosynthesis protein CobU n=1 Tax=Salmonella enterica I TaxID=59201 RepID=A0A379URG4_SALET|nr:adenosylcobinamide kinase/adenosylcobinamide-phosphate guanylyltransferase [Salmonella enterica subsp. enterica]
MADAVLQTHRQGVPVMGICGGYQMLGDTIVDEVESGLGTQPGLGLLNTITRFAQDKTTTQVNATMSGELPGWLAAAAGLPVRGYEIHMGETVLQEGCCTAMTLQKMDALWRMARSPPTDWRLALTFTACLTAMPLPVRWSMGYGREKGLRRGKRLFVMRIIKRGNLICWRKRCGNILILIKFIPSCNNIRSRYDDSGDGRARSGKSRHAEALIGDAPQVLYIATSQILDDEMAARIQHHKDGRPAHWRTAECWRHLDTLITADLAPDDAILLECITTMVTNLLFALGGENDPEQWDYAAMERAIDDEIQILIAACQRCPAKVVLVTNEVGMGIVPENRLRAIFVILPVGSTNDWRQRRMRSGW